jgi:hypothetical protein
VNLEADISRTRPASPTEQKIRQFLKGKRRVSASLSATLVKLDGWSALIVADEQAALDPVHAKVILGPVCDTVENIARSFIHNSKDIESQLILKSLQEALLYCVEFSSELSYSQTRKRIKEFVRKDRLALIRRFLSLFFFNFVWYYSSESFRALAWTSADFEASMENVEALCQKVVYSAVNSARHPLDAGIANELVREIEHQLRS